MENIFDKFKFLLQLYARPARAFGNIIDNGSWLFGALAVLAVAFAFNLGINARLQAAFGVPRFDVETYSQPNFARDLPNVARLDREQLERARENAAYRNYQEALRERQKLPLVGDAGLWFAGFDNGFFALLLSLAIFYVPATVLLLTLFEPVGSFGLLLRRDYAVLLACATAAWAAAHLPFAIIGLILREQAIDANLLLVLWAASKVYFAVLMVFALRTVFGASFRGAILTVCLAWVSINLGARVLGFVSPFLLSPFILFYAWMYFSGEAKTFGQSFRSRQNFRRFLNNAAVNPRDADAHIQLGILYKQRRQTSEAVKHFEKALEIDAREIDANYEIGKIRREAGDYATALNHFSIVAEQNDRYATDEIWREIGATYLDAGAPKEARAFLEKFVERRAFDAEGLYYLGQTLKTLGEAEQAREMFRRCIEAVQTAPDYRRGTARKWSQLARKQMA